MSEIESGGLIEKNIVHRHSNNNISGNYAGLWIWYTDSVTLSEDELILEAGESHPLTATVLPENATNKNIEWSSSDETVATVDDNGLIVANAEGTVTITVTTVDGSESASLTLTVTAAESDEGVDISALASLLEEAKGYTSADGKYKADSFALLESPLPVQSQR